MITKLEGVVKDTIRRREIISKNSSPANTLTLPLAFSPVDWIISTEIETDAFLWPPIASYDVERLLTLQWVWLSFCTVRCCATADTAVSVVVFLYSTMLCHCWHCSECGCLFAQYDAVPLLTLQWVWLSFCTMLCDCWCYSECGCLKHKDSVGNKRSISPAQKTHSSP